MTDNLRNGEYKHVAAKPLWSDADKTRQFLIPDTLELPSGEFLLRTATGRKQCVNPAVLSSFEVLFGASERVQGQGKYPSRASWLSPGYDYMEDRRRRHALPYYD